MKNLICLLLLGLIFASCSKNETIDPLSTSLDLNITKLNASNSQTHSVKLNSYTSKYSGWWNSYGAEGISIQKSIIFNTTLPDNEGIKIEISFSKSESEQLLKLDETITGFDNGFPNKHWDYLSYKDKANSFYTNNSSRRLEINGSNVMFGNVPSVNPDKQVTFDVVKTEEVKVDGKSKTRITLKIKGDLHPYYSDWRSPEAATYRVEGEFSGIIE